MLLKMTFDDDYGGLTSEFDNDQVCKELSQLAQNECKAETTSLPADQNEVDQPETAAGWIDVFGSILMFYCQRLTVLVDGEQHGTLDGALAYSRVAYFNVGANFS